MASWKIKIGGLCAVGAGFSVLITTLQDPMFNWMDFFVSLITFLFIEQLWLGIILIGIASFFIGMHWGLAGVVAVFLGNMMLFVLYVIVIPVAFAVVLIIFLLIYIPPLIVLVPIIYIGVTVQQFTRWLTYAVLTGVLVLVGSLFSIPVIGWVVGYVAIPAVVLFAIIYGIGVFTVLGGATVNLYGHSQRNCDDKKTLICKLIRA